MIDIVIVSAVDKREGSLASLCIGGGMGAALANER